MSYINQVIILQCGPPSHLSKKDLSFPFSLGKKRVYMETQLKEEFPDLF